MQVGVSLGLGYGRVGVGGAVLCSVIFYLGWGFGVGLGIGLGWGVGVEDGAGWLVLVLVADCMYSTQCSPHRLT